ncbi:MAG: lipopolysaccharide heptosyltransferase II [Acidobacteriota bacterium]
MTGSVAPKRLVVRATNWVGDAVMSLPALKELRRRFPRAHLAVVARDWVADLYRGQGLADEIFVIPRGRRSLHLAPRLRGFDCAILFQNAFEAALLAFLARIPERCGYAVQGRGWLLTHKVRPRAALQGKHQAYYYLDLLYRLGLTDRDFLAANDSPDISLRIPESAEERLAEVLQRHGVDYRLPLAALHPGAAYGPAKRWPAERFAALADRLQERTELRVVFVGSSGERGLAEAIRRLMRTQPVLLHGETDLPMLLALFRRSRLVVTNDSGPMHLAAAAGAPQIALFGSTDEVATGPLNPRAVVIARHPECSPCFRRTCPIDLRCFRSITVEDVWAAAERILQSGDGGTLPR